MADLIARQAAPVSADRQDYFDRYWIRRDFVRTDRRTMERAQLVWRHITRRRGRALDGGCGRGLFAAFLAEQGLVVDALDISAQAVDLTRQRGIPACQIDLEQQTPSGCFDLVFCLEVLQQVDPGQVMARRSTRGKNAYEWYFLAMVHHELGNAEEARAYYELAIRDTESRAISTRGRHELFELLVFRDEAEAVLGIERGN